MQYLQTECFYTDSARYGAAILGDADTYTGNGA